MRKVFMDPGQRLNAEMPKDAAELAGIVRDAGAARQGLRLVGFGAWNALAPRVRASRVVSLMEMRGITSYNPSDLTLSCGAGTTIAELDEATRAHGQWCPLAPPGLDMTSTIGATVATAMEGPYAATLGRPRSLVLGLECVDGTGRIIRSGGRVVKNVAGFDLTRAMIGAWGTLGAITQVHLRLRALPAVEEAWTLMTKPSDAALVEAYARGPVAPLACVNASAMFALDAAFDVWIVRIGGNAEFVARSREQLRTLGQVDEQHPDALDAWRINQDPPPRALIWRWDALSMRLRERFDPHRIMNPGLLGEPA